MSQNLPHIYTKADAWYRFAINFGTLVSSGCVLDPGVSVSPEIWSDPDPIPVSKIWSDPDTVFKFGLDPV